MKLSERLLSCVHAIWQNTGPVSTALLPLSWITGLVVRRRQQQAQQTRPDPSVPPTIVVGNLVVGGTGKTPVVIAVVQYLQAHGWSPGVVSRGYGARLGQEPRTGQGMLETTHFGDEPALIAQVTGAPISVHPRRNLARAALVRDFSTVDIVVSDDGLQHLALTRDVEIVVQDKRGIGNGRLLPAGPLREPRHKLASVDFIINNGVNNPPAHTTATQDRQSIAPEQIRMDLQPTVAEHLASGQRQPWELWLQQHHTSSLAAVAAIGQPARFFDMLGDAGLAPSTTLALPDHDAYQHSPFTGLAEQVVVVTAKDAVKCRRFADPRVWAIHVEAQFSDPTWLDRLAARLVHRLDDTAHESIKL